MTAKTEDADINKFWVNVSGSRRYIPASDEEMVILHIAHGDGAADGFVPPGGREEMCIRDSRELAAVHRQFARVGVEREALDADEIADVEQFLEHRVV